MRVKVRFAPALSLAKPIYSGGTGLQKVQMRDRVEMHSRRERREGQHGRDTEAWFSNDIKGSGLWSTGRAW